MAKKSESTVKKFTIGKGTSKKTALAKVNIPQMDFAAFRDAEEKLLTQAREEIPAITRARATVTLY